MSFFSATNLVTSKFLVCLFNSYLIYNFKFNFLNNTSGFQINDARQLPIIIPSKEQLKEFEELFNQALKIKQDQFSETIKKSEAKNKLNKIQKTLDKMVYELYKLPESKK